MLLLGLSNSFIDYELKLFKVDQIEKFLNHVIPILVNYEHCDLVLDFLQNLFGDHRIIWEDFD
jgi:hypothetical protein